MLAPQNETVAQVEFRPILLPPFGRKATDHRKNSDPQLRRIVTRAGPWPSPFLILLLRLIRPHERGFGQNVAAHGLLETGLGGRARKAEHRIEGIKLVEITVPPDRRKRTAIAGAFPVIQPLARSRRQRFHALRQARRGRRDIIKHPMHPNHLWRGRVGSVGIIDDKGKAFCSGRNARPCKWRRQVFAFTGIPAWNFAPRSKS